MQIEVRAKDEDGNLIFEGKLNKNETSFLIGYAINDLLHAGVMFNIDGDQENGDLDEAPSRIEVPKEVLN